MARKTIAFFPEAAFGPALNSVGIAQACEKLGHKAVFLTDPGMQGVYSGYGFEEHSVKYVRAYASRGDGKVLDGLHQWTHPELRSFSVRTDRQLRQRMLGGYR